jgi:thymidylate synthase ThyX
MISAQILCDSINDNGNRLTTFLLQYPRYIHSELLTHRMFSKNSSSSRAIPIEKMIQKVIDNPVYPIMMYNQKGMAASEFLEGEELVSTKQDWDDARDYAVIYAKRLAKKGVHKQIANRLLEPFSHIAVILSATEFENFFKLRIHPAAQQEIQAVATKMKRELDTARPTLLSVGQWHLPFILERELELPLLDKIKISVARCARVSYYNFDNQQDLEDDKKLFDSLKDSGHFSPFEHVAMASSSNQMVANFRGFVQARSFIEQASTGLDLLKVHETN